MDPYVEASGLWEDFHHDLITEIKGAISAVLPERYVVLAGERSYVVLSGQNGDEEFLTNPDVGVARLAGTAPSSAGLKETSGKTTVLQAADPESEPIVMRPFVEAEYREGFLEIREVHSDRKLVTCIEALSPSNKRAGTPGWHQYVRSARGSWKERPTLSKSIFSAAADACPGPANSRTALIICSSAENRKRSIARFGAPIPCVPCGRSRFPWPRPIRTSPLPFSRSSKRFMSDHTTTGLLTIASRSIHRWALPGLHGFKNGCGNTRLPANP
jgi:hypothetical protein